MRRALILVDIQNDYFTGGKMELVAMESAAENAAVLLGEARRNNDAVYHVQHLSVNPGATFFLPGTDGAATHRSVAPEEDEVVIQKNYPNSFRETPLLDALRNHDTNQLTICGAMSHMCVDATVRAAADYGFECTVAEDACATRDLEFQGRQVDARQVHDAFMAALGAAYARVDSTEKLVKSRE